MSKVWGIAPFPLGWLIGRLVILPILGWRWCENFHCCPYLGSVVGDRCVFSAVDDPKLATLEEIAGVF